MSRLKVAMLGAGGIAQAHSQGWLALADRFQVTVVCDVDGAKATALAAAHPNAFACTGIAEALAVDGVDVVDISLPPFMHHEAALAALEAGLHVVCEKPLAATVAEIDQLTARARARQRVLMPVFQHRCGNGFRQLRHLVAAGIAGRPLVTAIETHWNRGADYYAVPWRGKRETELGGVILTHAIHANDLACAIHGAPVRVHARLETAVNPIETEDCAALSMEMADGALLTHSITLGSADEISRLRFCFTRLTAESSFEAYAIGAEPWRFLPRGEGAAAAIEQALGSFRHCTEGFAGLFEALHAHLTRGEPLPVTLGDGRVSIALARAIDRSAESGEDVALPPPA